MYTINPKGGGEEEKRKKADEVRYHTSSKMKDLISP